MRYELERIAEQLESDLIVTLNFAVAVGQQCASKRAMIPRRAYSRIVEKIPNPQATEAPQIYAGGILIIPEA